MVQVCFVLDLRSLAPALLRDVKLSLLQLANFYAISPSLSSLRTSDSLRDRIGLCYILKNRISSCDELKIAYSPGENFNLRDFHYAVNHLPTDAFLLGINDSSALCLPGDLKLPTILTDQVLFSWGVGKDIARKVRVLSSFFPEDVDFAMRKSLMDAADKCVLFEFLFFEQKSGHLSNTQENINNFLRCISDLDNCSYQTYLPDIRLLHGLVKQWKADLEDDREEPLLARFVFKNNLVGSVNQISGNLYISVHKIIDDFSPCQTCRCHGIPLEDAKRSTLVGHRCRVTGHDLGTCDVIGNSVKVGENTILLLPSLDSSMKFQQIASPIEFNVAERINLGSLSEGSVVGDSYVVIPSACYDIEAATDDIDQLDLNTRLFQGLCRVLHMLGQGLVCSSNCNIETMREAAFHCYYFLQPSDNGPMLLRRLAGSEEVSWVPDLNCSIHSPVSKEIQNSVLSSLLKIELKDYDPLLHERGFHQKLNLLVKESLQFGSIPPKFKEVAFELKLCQPEASEGILQSNSGPDIGHVEEELIDLTVGEDKTSADVTEEWEQLVIKKVPNLHSPIFISEHELDQSDLLPPKRNRQLDRETSRILERLELPRQLKTEAVITSSGMVDACNPMKKPHIPVHSINATDRGLTGKLMTPNFKRPKRKH